MQVFSLILAFLFFPWEGYTPTNKDLLDPEILQAVITSDVIAEMDSPFLLQITNVPDGLYQKMVSELLDDGKQLKNNQGEHHVIRITLEAENVIYRKGRKDFDRRLHVQLSITKIDPDQNIVQNEIKEIELEDAVSERNPKILSGTADIYTFHQVLSSKSGRVISRYAEPAIITTATAITIYLLYNVRSR